MRFFKTFIFLLLTATSMHTYAVNSETMPSVEAISNIETLELNTKQEKKYTKIQNRIKEKLSNARHDKLSIIAIVALVLFGGFGLHRIILGTPNPNAYLLPFFYFFTIGGFLGLIPLIDLIRIIIDPNHYRENAKAFACFGAK